MSECMLSPKLEPRALVLVKGVPPLGGMLTRILIYGYNFDHPSPKAGICVIPGPDPIKRVIVYMALGKFTKLYKALQISQMMVAFRQGHNSLQCRINLAAICQLPALLNENYDTALSATYLLSISQSGGDQKDPFKTSSSRSSSRARVRQQHQNQAPTNLVENSLKVRLEAHPNIIKTGSQDSPRPLRSFKFCTPLSENFKLLAHRTKIKPLPICFGPGLKRITNTLGARNNPMIVSAHADPDRMPLRFLPGTGRRMGPSRCKALSSHTKPCKPDQLGMQYSPAFRDAASINIAPALHFNEILDPLLIYSIFPAFGSRSPTSAIGCRSETKEERPFNTAILRSELQPRPFMIMASRIVRFHSGVRALVT
ncbi:hypothetical protein DFH09DRAFT_1078313 [Mycena vulgaris]|nr:hypothetical protein DFH09DRAFT_1078313 [Mycena vulgaris]